MRKTDVAIIGGGLAGSLTAVMLGRAGIDCLLVDPRETYPADFRCEKLDGPQAAILEKTGLGDALRRSATFDGGCWMARFGRIIEKRPGDQYGILYGDLVNTVRGEIPASVPLVCDKARALSTSADRQVVTLGSGEHIDARLVVLANGLSVSLRDSLGIAREVTSACHSVTVGFTIRPRGRQQFGFPALTYYAESPAAKCALITVFPIGSGMRANLFTYRDFNDPWLQEMRADPQQTLYALMPKLYPILGDFTVEGRVEVRPVDLYVTRGYRRPGVVLVGDAFATSCPAAGTGARKVLVDVERLCNHYVRGWLATPGMGPAKISAFYDDPVKQDCDEFAAEKAVALKSMSLDASVFGDAHRVARFVAQAGRGALRAAFRARRHSGERAAAAQGADALARSA